MNHSMWVIFSFYLPLNPSDHCFVGPEGNLVNSEYKAAKFKTKRAAVEFAVANGFRVTHKDKDGEYIPGGWDIAKIWDLDKYTD